MLVPSIDIMNGKAVQLREGREHVLSAGNPLEVAKKFSVAGEIAVIDLDAAMGNGSNKNIIMELIYNYPCRVGGGIRDIETAIEYLNAGAEKIIIGTAANEKFLNKLPSTRLIAALDVRGDTVLVNGWHQCTEKKLMEQIKSIEKVQYGIAERVEQ